MWDLFYYIASVGMIGTFGYGMLYMYDRNIAEDIGRQISWNTVKAYHKVNLELENMKIWYINKRYGELEDEVEDELDDLPNIEFIGYTEKVDTTYTTRNIESNNYITNTTFDLMFLKKTDESGVVYKRIFDKETITKDIKIVTIKKPFIQIELCQDNENTAIHKNLDCFYIEDNKILDTKFLKWYVKTFYDIILNENYTLSVIDTEICMFKMTKEQHVKIKDKYEIITEE
jgi:hypothetical protein